MDLDRLTAQLALATSFRDRSELARQAATDMQPGELGKVVRLLGQDVETVRLGAIEVLRAARFLPALKPLIAVTLQRAGEERAFAARAVAEMADSDDPEHHKLLSSVIRRWRSLGDDFLHLHADTLAGKLGLPVAPAAPRAPAGESLATTASSPPARAPAPGGDTVGQVPVFGITAADRDARAQAIARTIETLDDAENALCDAALDTGSAGARMDLVQAIASLGEARMSRVLERIARSGNGDVAALFLRSYRPYVETLPTERQSALQTVLEQSRRRYRDHDLARAAIDDCLVVLRPDGELRSLVQNADRIAAEAAYRLAHRLMEVPEDERDQHVRDLFPALERAPRRALLFAPLLGWAWPQTRPHRRDEWRAVLSSAAAKEFPGGLSTDAVAAIGRLYAQAQRPGRSAPTHVIAALDEHRDAATAQAAIAVYEASATEDAAHAIAEYLADPQEAVRDAAQDALGAIEAPVKMRFSEDGVTIEPNYTTASGDPLIAEKGRLATAAGVRYVLDIDGDPKRASDTRFGGCVCCRRPRELSRYGRELPACPVTGIAHLIADDQSMLAKDHPLGWCTECESVAPLVRRGDTIYCRSCRTEYVLRPGALVRTPRRR